MLATSNRPSLKRNHDPEAPTISPYFIGVLPGSVLLKKQRIDHSDKADNHNSYDLFSPISLTTVTAEAFDAHHYIAESDGTLSPVSSPVQSPPTSYEFFTARPIAQTTDIATALYRTLAPQPAYSNIWDDDIMFPHSDDEEEDPNPNPTPVSPTLGPAKTTCSQPIAKKYLLPCDPGIKRTSTIDRSSMTRWILRFDPDIPRPEHARVLTFGHIPGLYIGKRWHSRMGASWDGTHTPTIAGIAGRSRVGAVSIALSGGYEDDFDEGYRFVYTGSGGRDLKVGKGARTGPQAKHQNWNSSNSALRMNIKTERPVRVIRGRQGDPFWSPAEGFMYSGLYEVVACWTEQGKSGFDVIRFAFKRLPRQDPLLNGAGEPAPEPDYDSEDWVSWESWLTDERAEEVVAFKKEESPGPKEASTTDITASDVAYIKSEEDD